MRKNVVLKILDACLAPLIGTAIGDPRVGGAAAGVGGSLAATTESPSSSGGGNPLIAGILTFSALIKKLALKKSCQNHTLPK